jgi:hypothetical protein
MTPSAVLDLSPANMRRSMRGSIAGLVIVLSCAFGLSGCGAKSTVKAEAIAFEPTIVGCSGPPTQCASGNDVTLRESREARNHRCPDDKPNVLIKSDGALVCVVALRSPGSIVGGTPIPNAVQQHGLEAVASFRAGNTVLATSGCLACHRLGEDGNSGPGPNLTHVGSILTAPAIARALIDARAPMPSFRGLPESKSRALVYFLSELR